MRHLVMAGEGNSDSAITVVGLLLGACIAHNFKLASAAQTVKDGVVSGGPTAAGKIAVTICLFVLLGISVFHTIKKPVPIQKGVVL